MKGQHGYVQGYNAQAVVNESQIVLAAEITHRRERLPRICADDRPAPGGARACRVSDAPQVAVADAGSAKSSQMTTVMTASLLDLDSGKPTANDLMDRRRYTWMRALLATELGGELYRKRKQTVEPLFGHTKHNRQFDRFRQRGRAACARSGD